MRYLALFLAMLPVALPAAECRARSGERTAALVELYTSEGCSSCPPADRWISSFAAPARADPNVVPIAFHVHYWDYIGWKDMFADVRYTERQRDLAKAAGANMVYTPQVMIGGRDSREWRDEGAARSSIERINSVPARAWIEIESRATAGSGMKGVATARLPTGWKPGDYALYVAVTQNGLSNKPTAGENRGEQLRHNFVARDFAVVRKAAGSSPAALRAEFDFKSKADWDFARLGVVAFVQNVKTGEVLQALAASCPG